MPLINGIKMACEPCIRGHRSTKCTHASERLMVPVRKPGRPLSICPHPQDQPCSCGTGVTAAIPRKQGCNCGGGVAMLQKADAQEAIEAPNEVSSPTKTSFKVQKQTSRPTSSRRQSYDPANFERMNVNDINIVKLDQRPQVMSSHLGTGYVGPGHLPLNYGNPQFANTLRQPYQYAPMPANINFGLADEVNTQGQGTSQNGLESINEISASRSIKSNDIPTANSCCGPKTEITNGVTEVSSTSTVPLSHSHSSSSTSSISEPPESTLASCCTSKTTTQASEKQSSEPEVADCCASKSETNMPKQEHDLDTPSSSLMAPQIFPQGSVPFSPLYPAYLVHNTVFTYPSSYGSFHNPLQQSEWRQSAQANSYGQSQLSTHRPSTADPFDGTIVSPDLSTIHTCGCGDTCQCIGCAAHPYNDATQEYVRSAWSSMAMESSNDVYPNGKGNLSQTPGEMINSPSANTPSSIASGAGEEQSLSASDFFFVNYPVSDECGGDTQSCPCGDDCQCLGCTIHRHPAIPCEGEKNSCPCGDDCECIGCEFHNGPLKL